jgi:hypothetical protein
MAGGAGGGDSEREILLAIYLANRQEDATWAPTTLALIAAVISYVLLVSAYASDHESIGPLVLLGLPAVPLALAAFQISLGTVAGMRRHEGEVIEKRLQCLVSQDGYGPRLPGHLQSNRNVWDFEKARIPFRVILYGLWIAGYLFVLFFTFQMLWLAGHRGEGAWWWGSVLAGIVYLVFFAFSMVAMFRPGDRKPPAP